MPESPRPASGGSTARLIHLSDFEQIGAVFTSWQGRFEQLSSGRFEAALRVVRGGRVRVSGIEANQRVVIRGHDTAGVFSVYPVTAANAASVWQGRQLAPGRVVVNGVRTEVDHVSGRRTENLGVSLRPETLQDAARALLAADVVPVPQTWAALSPPPDAFAGLTRHLSRLLGRGVADPSLLGTPEGDRLEQECVRALVASLYSAAPQPDLSSPARARLLRRAEDLMRSRLGALVGAIDLCRELGVSDRTLRLAFRERFGVGPMAYFKCLRLNAVRSQLRADPAAAVAAAARAFGFHHLGNFAADYRRLFGERPSETPRGGSDGTPSPGRRVPSG